MEDEARLLSSTTGSDLGAQLRSARQNAGHSLAAMASMTHFSKSYLGHIETGLRVPTPDVIERYEQVLGVAIGTPFDPVRLTHEWLLDRPPLAPQLNPGRRIGGATLQSLEARVIELRHLDDTVGSRTLLPLVRDALDDAVVLTREGVYPDRLGVRLFTVVGELSQLAGWIASDAGKYQRAQQLYLTGVRAAEDAGDRVLGAQLLSSLAYQMSNVGNRDDGFLIARSTVSGAHDATPAVRALLTERLAWAAARCHDVETTRRALDAVDDAYERRSDGAAEPEWVYWLNRNEIDVMAARCHIQLGIPGEAEPLLRRALAGYDHSHIRETALYQTWLAESHARTGDLDAARALLDQIDTASVDEGSVRLKRRILAVNQLVHRRRGKVER
ncbi:helix-turn-helix transcriptional regulator [Actinoplanes sp. TBRC 11911]|uniref:helix-turn-helix domain-containing protein n=1 Tax=Actinoplanes sp. TBRC 11911 TaxID=2729386 RepID=UPI0020070EC0|nr:helix-turn-helix transcriptional regulator [Actinoplanes sp. TBRC 11911]